MATAQPTTASKSTVPEPASATRVLSGHLGVGSIIFMVVAAAAPLTAIGGALPIGALLGDGAGVPSMFTIGAIILLFFSVGLSAMTRFIPKPGAFFTYVGYGLGRPAGVAAAYLALLCYTTIQVAVYGYIGSTLETAVVTLGGPELPWYLYALLATVVVGILGYRHIELSGKVLSVLLVAEMGIVLVLSVSILAHGGYHGNSITTQSFQPSSIFSGSPALGLMFTLGSFIGFESTAIFRDEARNPEKTIPRATYGAVILIGAFYTFSSWALVGAWGPKFMSMITSHPDTSYIVITANNYIGAVGGVIVNVLLITSMFACILSFHNVVTRYQHSMSNASLLPHAVSKVHSRHSSPFVSSLVQSATAGVLIIVFALFRLEPVAQVFTWFGGISTVTISALMALTCIAVIVYFATKKIKAGIWRVIVAPGIGIVGLVGITWLMVVNFPLLIGEVNAQGAPVFGVLSVAFLATMLAFPIFGVVQSLILRRHKPEAYSKVIDTISD